MATFSSYDQVGKKEDINDKVSNIAPTKTPFVTMIGSRPVKNTLFQWQEDTLDAPAANAQVEGAAAPAASQTATTMRNNLTQIFSKVASVTGTADAVETYGRTEEMAYQMAKKSAEVKRDLEKAYIGLTQTRVTGDATSVARKFDAAQVMITSTLQFHAADASVGLTGTGNAAFNETVLKAANQALYVAGGEATVLMIKPADAPRIADFAAATGRLREIGADSKTITNVVNVYVSPFGEQKVVMNRWQVLTHAYLIDPAMWKKGTLRPWFRQTLAKTGDKTDIQILGEFSLMHLNYSASALIGDLS